MLGKLKYVLKFQSNFGGFRCSPPFKKLSINNVQVFSIVLLRPDSSLSRMPLNNLESLMHCSVQ